MKKTLPLLGLTAVTAIMLTGCVISPPPLDEIQDPISSPVDDGYSPNPFETTDPIAPANPTPTETPRASTSPTEPSTAPQPSQDVPTPQPSQDVPPQRPDTPGDAESQNATRAAENYLSVMPFSREGLIKQLAYEGFSQEASTKAVDSLNVDWNAQAVKAAEQYLELMPFSKSGLIDQLLFEGFTQAQAEHGATAAGL